MLTKHADSSKCAFSNGLGESGTLGSGQVLLCDTVSFQVKTYWKSVPVDSAIWNI